MSEKVGFGVIGVGGIGAGHVLRIQSLKNAELVAVCDINPAAFDRIEASTREKILCTTELEEFLNCPGLEAVIIAVPHYDHPDLAIAAMEHGKHVIVEKPIAVHKAEAERLIAEAKKYFNYDSAIQCKSTDYAVAGGAYANSSGNCWWWLRSPGDIQSSAAFVYSDGDVIESGNYVNLDNYAVRPALWIDLGA